MKHPLPALVGLLALLLCATAIDARAEEPDTLVAPPDPERYGVVVSATKIAQDPLDVPNATQIVSGADLRLRGSRTLADALEDVVGLDVGNGSDNGMRFPNVGMWGLKEFDALLVTLNGVPLGGPFNPELEQIPVEDIDRIEIVKGPQGTLYGVSAFAGMVSVFTRDMESKRGHLTLGGGSFSDGFGDAGWQQALGKWSVRLTGAMERSDGWQDRTGLEADQGSASLSGPLGVGRFSVQVVGRHDLQRWGSPLPLDPQTGELDPNFDVGGNAAVGGARVDHHIWSANSQLSWPVGAQRIENTFGFTRDNQFTIKSFPQPDAAAGDTVPSAGILLRPEQNTAFDDLRLVSRFALGGNHEAVLGGAITYGKVTADGEGFDFEQIARDPSSIPHIGSLPAGDLRSFNDERTFLGGYAHDSWTPEKVPQLTISGGGRFDQAHEKLHAQAQEQDGVSPLEVADDERTDQAWSGDLGGVVRLLPRPTSGIEALNLYANWKSSFKPAAPNLTEAEGAKILRPEHTHSAMTVSWFDLTFNNLVLPILGSDSLPELVNAGEERFKGVEASINAAPRALRGISFGVGYAHHDPRFVQFAFLNPDGEIEDDSGNLIELAAKDLINARVAYRSPVGVGVFGAVRWAGQRALDRDNHFFLDSYSEYDAGANYEGRGWRASVTVRNLGDSRHIVAESDLADAMFYLAPPRRVTAQISYDF